VVAGAFGRHVQFSQYLMADGGVAG